MRSPSAGLAIVIATGLLLTGCGTRVSDAEVAAGAGGGPVSVPESVLAEIRSAIPATDAAAPTAVGPPPGAGTDDAAAPAASDALGDPAGPGAAPPAPAEGKPGARRPAAAGPAPASADDRGTAAKGAATARTCTGNEAPVVLGQVGTFSGVAGPITASARTAGAVWAKAVNARGGLACHPVQLFTVDDGGDPARTAAVVQDLVENKKAVAIVAAFAPLTLNGLVPAVEKYKLPVIGGDLAGFEWNSHPNLFPQGPGLRPIIRGLIKQSVDAGKTQLGLIYCVEAAVCTTGAKVIPEEAERAGAELVYSSAVSLTQTDFTAQCQNAKNAGVQVLGVAVDGSSIGRLARSCAALNYFPQLGTSALVVNNEQARDPAIRKNTLTTAVPNAPWFLKDNPGLREFHDAFATFAPGFEVDANAMAAWAAGKLAEAAVAGLPASAATAPLTSEAMFAALGTVKNETLDGLAPPITFRAGQKAAPDLTCVYYALLTDAGWEASTGSKPLCQKES